MIGVFIAIVVAAVIVFGAVRIILGWTLPAPLMARIDALFWKLNAVYLKLVVVICAVAIVAVVVTGFSH